MTQAQHKSGKEIETPGRGESGPDRMELTQYERSMIRYAARLNKAVHVSEVV